MDNSILKEQEGGVLGMAQKKKASKKSKKSTGSKKC